VALRRLPHYETFGHSDVLRRQNVSRDSAVGRLRNLVAQLRGNACIVAMLLLAAGAAVALRRARALAD
jgi:hypothetical protein